MGASSGLNKERRSIPVWISGLQEKANSAGVDGVRAEASARIRGMSGRLASAATASQIRKKRSAVTPLPSCSSASGGSPARRSTCTGEIFRIAQVFCVALANGYLSLRGIGPCRFKGDTVAAAKDGHKYT